MKPPFWATLVIGIVSICATVIGSIWGGFEVLDIKMDHKVIASEKKLVSIMDERRDARDAELREREKRFLTEVKNAMNEVRTDVKRLEGKVDTLQSFVRRSSEVRLQKGDLYTKIEGEPNTDKN